MNGGDDSSKSGSPSTDAAARPPVDVPVEVDPEEEARIIAAVLEDEERPRIANPEMPYDVEHADAKRPPPKDNR